MNKKVLLFIPFALTVAGCAVAPVDKGSPDCVVDTRPVLKCNPADLEKVTLTLGNMQANPPSVCATPGGTIKVKIAPKPSEKGTVSVFAKNVADTWLNSSNYSDPEYLHIHVPTWVTVGSVYEYGFSTRMGTCADPRVEIIPSLAPMLEQAAEPAAD